MDRLSTNGQMLSQVELQKLPHSSFDMANHNFLSGKLGKLIPTRIDEVYPGDTIKGHIQAVSNFEPLVGPIMGSMVTKQESFYVPLNEVWKNADKFFSAKKGFDTPMPAVSPYDVYGAYQSLGLIPDLPTFVDYLEDLYDTLTADPYVSDDTIDVHTTIVNDMMLIYNTLRSFGDQYYVRDLVQPILDKWQNDILGQISSHGVPSGQDTYLYEQVQNMVTAVDSNARFEYFKLYVSAFLESMRYAFDYFFGPSSLLDYAGWPVNDNYEGYFNEIYKVLESVFVYPAPVSIDLTFSKIPLNWLKFRALYLCWYWNYRDQLLEQDAYDPESDEFLSDTVTPVQMILLTLLRVRCWYKDTFTTALTNTGTGNFKVPLDSNPLGDESIKWNYYAGDSISDNEVLLDTKDYATAYTAGATIAKVTIGNIEYSVPMQYLQGAMDGGVNLGLFRSNSNESSFGLSFDLFDRLRRLQSFTEKELLLGYEIDDVIYAHFMVRLSNIRMRIPELLSRGREEVQINTIVNNTDVPDGQPAGDKTAVAWSNCRTSDIHYFSEYWGYFISFYTVMPIQSYTGGLDRSWLKLNRFDFAWPDFATIGMDAVYNCELAAPRGEYAKNGLTDTEALAIFGYQGRYYDLKSKRDEEHGRIRTDLNYLTFSREWNSENPPKLNYIFVHCWPRLDMFVTDDPNVDVIKQIDVYHDIDYYRAYPVPSEYLG